MTKKGFLHKLICPVISSLTTMIAILLVFVACILPFITSQALKQSQSVDLITKEVDKIINNCGKDFRVSWIVVDPNKKIYKFHDVRGLNADSSAIVSSKNPQLNPFYSKIHKIDPITFSFLDKFDNGAAGFYPEISFFNDKKSARDMISSSNKIIFKVGISVTKNILDNMVYVFIATITSDSYNVCSKDDIVTHLEDLSIYAKGI